MLLTFELAAELAFESTTELAFEVDAFEMPAAGEVAFEGPFEVPAAFVFGESAFEEAAAPGEEAPPFDEAGDTAAFEEPALELSPAFEEPAKDDEPPPVTDDETPAFEPAAEEPTAEEAANFEAGATDVFEAPAFWLLGVAGLEVGAALEAPPAFEPATEEPPTLEETAEEPPALEDTAEEPRTAFEKLLVLAAELPPMAEEEPAADTVEAILERP